MTERELWRQWRHWLVPFLVMLAEAILLTAAVVLLV